ncbi:sensor histidine kinase [Natronorubrum halophilum]|uniref:sensor histidine kinase n=1 Tax=Natronorubrum halophilum TaxID=1702106 RepID=UPI0010C216AA|nr:ATP-binding protein [Natronorubrum halophilum]
MAHWERIVTAVGGRRLVVALGVSYTVLALGWALAQIAEGNPLSSVLIVTLFIGVPGITLLYGGYRLPDLGVRPEFYPVIAGWCLGGFGLMLGSLVLYQLEPAESVSDPSRAALVLTAFGSLAGFGVGIYDARAKTGAREVELRNRELDRTRAQLEASNERLEQFAYAASHDLEEPLRMITSYLTLIERRYADELDDDGEEFIEFAVDGAERMRQMIDGLLEYSRVDTQGKPFEPVDLNAVIADVRKDLELQLTDSGADVDIEELPRVEGDHAQLRQLFQNLLSNALEYNDDESPRVRVSAERTGPRWTVSVSDDGIGIDPEDSDRIFDVFQRLHTAEEHSGSGIGLALCRRIVERHGGEIWVESEPGEGSTFSFTLPATGDATR